jgi:hypothetical protein
MSDNVLQHQFSPDSATISLKRFEDVGSDNLVIIMSKRARSFDPMRISPKL